MITLAAIGIFLLAAELLGASVLGAGAAMAVTGLNAMVLHTALNPYFNQTWGYFTLPFTLVLGWWAVHHRSRQAAILLALFLAIGGFAYPLMLPIPLLALAIFVWLEPVSVPSPRAIYRGRRSLLWLVPLALVLIVPVAAALDKIWDATVLLVDPGTRSARGRGTSSPSSPRTSSSRCPSRCCGGSRSPRWSRSPSGCCSSSRVRSPPGSAR